MKEQLIARFKEVFNEDYSKAYFTPGRVNLIGEHVDYNGGCVFPCGLTIGTYAIVRLREDNKIRLFSENFKESGILEFTLDRLVKENQWTDYPLGELKTFLDEGYKIDRGFDILFFGNIPNGAGLSSSASLEVLTGFILKSLFSLDIEMIEIVKLSQKAENKFVGVDCGIMDQFAVGMAKKDKAILLDCNTLDYSYVTLKLDNHSILIANTNKRRGLADSAYNERRNECETALVELQTKLDIKSLGELSIDKFEENKNLIKDEVRKKRAKHAVYENARTERAVEALSQNNLKEFGLLMNQSHISLRDDYEVTGLYLDTMVEALWEEEGVVGARMTGAGFGGCTVSIVEDKFIDQIIENVGKKYTKKTKLVGEFYKVKVGAGAREI
jgi:galactokinase